MNVKLIPGPRNEELIQEIKIAAAKANGDTEALFDYACGIANCANDADKSAAFDALYYACENGEEMLADQEKYFNWCLLSEEFDYYIGRMTGHEV